MVHVNAFRPDSRVFTRVIPAKIDPVTEDVIQVAYTTPDELPDVPDGHVARRTGINAYGDAWEVVEDHVGESYWLGDTEYLMDDYGPLPEGATLVAPVSTTNITHITKLQCKKQASTEGLWSSLKDAISSDTETKEDWDLTTSLAIDDPLVLAMAQLMGKDQIELQTFFNNASLF